MLRAPPSSSTHATLPAVWETVSSEGNGALITCLREKRAAFAEAAMRIAARRGFQVICSRIRLLARTLPMNMTSYTIGPQTPLLADTIYEAFSKTAARVPDKVALIVRHQNVRLTFAQLAAEVERTARGLAGLGL